MVSFGFARLEPTKIPMPNIENATIIIDSMYINFLLLAGLGLCAGGVGVLVLDGSI